MVTQAMVEYVRMILEDAGDVLADCSKELEVPRGEEHIKQSKAMLRRMRCCLDLLDEADT